ncbi:MAG: hypothetical protein CSB44_03790 [Gammaproteobacteria bacterium]|nr:MAG: hypothetical protein CSB44_03790 [Gammaproteobacteria bacterium]
MPNAATAHRRLLMQLVESAIAEHPDEDVATRWAQMAKDTLARYPAPPNPSTHTLDLTALNALDDRSRRDVLERLGRFLTDWQGDVRDQLMNVHRDFLLLQCRVAELEVELARRRR